MVACASRARRCLPKPEGYVEREPLLAAAAIVVRDAMTVVVVAAVARRVAVAAIVRVAELRAA